jgi:Big-like domain-containing protein
MLKIVKGFCAASALVIISLAWIPQQAFAQVCVPGLLPCPDTTPPTVSITSPASGATVSGTITVTANAWDDVHVAGVQFQYNGINFGAEATSPPYQATAYTNSVPDGSYTLTAVARDDAGNRATSAPVTVKVANSAPPPAGIKRYEETDPSVSYSQVGWDWYESNWIGWSGGGAVASSLPGAQASFTFTGTSVTWIGYRFTAGGIARVSLDGVFVANVDLYARSAEVHVAVFHVNGLSNATHTLTIEVTGQKNLDSSSILVVVDAFDVPAPVVSHLQDTDSAMTYTPGWNLDTDSRMAWSGASAVVSATAGARATLPFNGTSISWNGLASPETGIAHVFLDGAFAGEVDTYSPTYKMQGTVFTSPPLADGNHTLTIEVEGLKNSASSSAQIVVDSFDVVTPGIRFEETDPSVTYTGTWTHGNLNRAWSSGSASESLTPGSQANFTFTGTSVRWIGLRQYTTGIARVYVDGVFVTDVDTYAPTSSPQDTLFISPPLAAGSHTLTIEVTGQKNVASANTWVVVDAFDVRP